MDYGDMHSEKTIIKNLPIVRPVQFISWYNSYFSEWCHWYQEL